VEFVCEGMDCIEGGVSLRALPHFRKILEHVLLEQVKNKYAVYLARIPSR
jgi:hypothetical protein